MENKTYEVTDICGVLGNATSVVASYHTRLWLYFNANARNGYANKKGNVMLRWRDDENKEIEFKKETHAIESISCDATNA